MLELKEIVKHYPAGGETVEALKGVSLSFRESEFVSILGPSGCGKTTMLNIIGGLDQYTSGDLIINGKSTKDFGNRDWDTYRNHSVGFVFQSYNLIPHQSVLQNVELALTLSGVSKAERRKRAKEALEQVGLGNQLYKKPAEMSGGQMQRVAIARAIVNNPDIVLADEPTGALDTETSIQVMDILKEISKDRLIIMVTHNPDIAEKYSTRIVRVLDGEITSDSAPLTEEEFESEMKKAQEKAKEEAKKKKPSMSFFTSFGLSLKNLFTKKGRTILTSFAGSIGIIGISLIYAVSEGTTTYIDSVQEETLSSYPLTLQAQQVDMSSLLQTFLGKAQSTSEHENDAVYQKAMFYEMMNSLNTLEAKENDLKSFKTYLEAERSKEDSETKLNTAVSGVQYTYDMNLLVYTKNIDGDIIISDSQKLMQDIMKNYMGMDFSFIMEMRDQSALGASSAMMNQQYLLWQEMLPGDNGKLINPVVEKQYDLVYGNWPSQYNEVLVVIDKENEMDDMSLYAMGLKSSDEINVTLDAIKNKTEVEYDNKKWSYDEICGMDFRVVLNSDCYTWDEKTGTYVDLRDTSAGLQYLYDNAMNLKICGIIKPNEDSVANMLTGSLVYTHELTKYVIEHTKSTEVVKRQLENEDVDVFTGLTFKESETAVDIDQKAKAFQDYIAEQNEQGKAEAYSKIMMIPAPEMLEATVAQTMGSMTRADMEAAMLQALTSQMGMNEADVASYITAMSDEEMSALFVQMIEENVRKQYEESVKEQLSAMSNAQLAGAMDMAMASYTKEQCAEYYEVVLEFSGATYKGNLKKLGCVDLDSPFTINIYASSFADKDVIEDAIATYNESVDDLSEISYVDYVGLMMSSITTIIDAITYVLIAFVAVSLVVSSIMIGVITLISVQERTKEIGILRAIGASKRNVSSMFNAETVIIGFTSGALGVLVTYLLCIPINLILHSLTGINTLSAVLPIPVAIILVLISMGLTLISGIIPSRSAAKKDPVVALRSE